MSPSSPAVDSAIHVCLCHSSQCAWRASNSKSNQHISKGEWLHQMGNFRSNVMIHFEDPPFSFQILMPSKPRPFSMLFSELWKMTKLLGRYWNRNKLTPMSSHGTSSQKTQTKCSTSLAGASPQTASRIGSREANQPSRSVLISSHG